MREMVYRRIAPPLIAPRALDRAIEMSGGVVSDLIRLLFDGCNQAFSAGHTQIDRSHIDEAVAEIRNGFSRFLREEHYEVMNQALRTGAVPAGPAALELFQALVLLEYRNQERWVMVHPAARDLLQAWLRRAGRARRRAGPRRR